jgi:hypothetical protein
MTDNSIITKSDKRNTLIILYIYVCNRKINTFISNIYTQSAHDITNKLRIIRATINDLQNIIQKGDTWKFINLNPTTPTIRGLVKLHEEDTHIHSFSSLSYDRSKASSKASSPHSAIQSFLLQMGVSSPFLKVIQ